MDLYSEIEKLISIGIKIFPINAGKFFEDIDSLKGQLDILASCADRINIILDIPYPGKSIVLR